MTRAECMEILNDKTNPLYKELHHTYYTNRHICKNYYDALGYKGYVLHHKIVNCTNYEEWKIDEILPMTRAEHSRLHMVIYEQGLGSEKSKIKAHVILKENYASGKLTIWNKGLTKETDPRIHESPRKGKTGEDFPFLKASKKGKSGGWNKNIQTDDLRYASLLWSNDPIRVEAASNYMKEHNPMQKQEYRDKISQAATGKKVYSNGKTVRRYIPGQEEAGFIQTKYFNKKNIKYYHSNKIINYCINCNNFMGSKVIYNNIIEHEVVQPICNNSKCQWYNE